MERKKSPYSRDEDTLVQKLCRKLAPGSADERQTPFRDKGVPHELQLLFPRENRRQVRLRWTTVQYAWGVRSEMEYLQPYLWRNHGRGLGLTVPWPRIALSMYGSVQCQSWDMFIKCAVVRDIRVITKFPGDPCQLSAGVYFEDALGVN